MNSKQNYTELSDEREKKKEGEARFE